MSKKEKPFYATYDDLFSKPALFQKQERQMQHYKKNTAKVQLNNQAKPSKKNQKRSTKKKKEEKAFSKTKLVGSVCILLVIAFFAIKGGETNSILPTEHIDEYEEVYPLKEVVKDETLEKDFSKPLMLTINDHTIVTNRGYELEILGDSDIEIQKEELSILPTNSEYTGYTYAAYISFYNNRQFDRSVSVFLSGNSMNGLNESFIKNKNSFSKAYLEDDIGDVKNGYVVTYEVGQYSKTTIARFFIFPDGTGVWTSLDIYDDKQPKLTSDNTLKELKEILNPVFTFMDENFVFKQSKEI